LNERTGKLLPANTTTFIFPSKTVTERIYPFLLKALLGNFLQIHPFNAAFQSHFADEKPFLPKTAQSTFG